RRHRETLPVLQLVELLVELLDLPGEIGRQRRSARELLLDRAPHAGCARSAAVAERRPRLADQVLDLANRLLPGLCLLGPRTLLLFERLCLLRCRRGGCLRLFLATAARLNRRVGGSLLTRCLIRDLARVLGDDLACTL